MKSKRFCNLVMYLRFAWERYGTLVLEAVTDWALAVERYSRRGKEPAQVSFKQHGGGGRRQRVQSIDPLNDKSCVSPAANTTRADGGRPNSCFNARDWNFIRSNVCRIRFIPTPSFRISVETPIFRETKFDSRIPSSPPLPLPFREPRVASCNARLRIKWKFSVHQTPLLTITSLLLHHRYSLFNRVYKIGSNNAHTLRHEFAASLMQFYQFPRAYENGTRRRWGGEGNLFLVIAYNTPYRPICCCCCCCCPIVTKFSQDY